MRYVHGVLTGLMLGAVIVLGVLIAQLKRDLRYEQKERRDACAALNSEWANSTANQATAMYNLRAWAEQVYENRNRTRIAYFRDGPGGRWHAIRWRAGGGEIATNDLDAVAAEAAKQDGSR